MNSISIELTYPDPNKVNSDQDLSVMIDGFSFRKFTGTMRWVLTTFLSYGMMESAREAFGKLRAHIESKGVIFDEREKTSEAEVEEEDTPEEGQ